MVVIRSAWLSALQALLPPGLAFTRESDTVLTSFLQAVSAQLATAQEFIDAIHAQGDPRAATKLLPDWEALLGLPDACTPMNQTLVERQQLAFGRLTESGGQNRDYFVDLAARYGEPGCTITEFPLANCNGDCNSAMCSLEDTFFWRVNIPRTIQNLHMANCNDDCNAALQTAEANVIECIFNERKPAATQVNFSYLEM